MKMMESKFKMQWSEFGRDKQKQLQKKKKKKMDKHWNIV